MSNCEYSINQEADDLLEAQLKISRKRLLKRFSKQQGKPSGYLRHDSTERAVTTHENVTYDQLYR